MAKAIIGVIVGFVVWTAMWLGGNALFFSRAAEIVAAEGRYDELAPLLGIIFLAGVCSFVAGAICALIAGARASGAVLVLGGLLLLVGIAVQTGAWSSLPVWYHLTFLVILVPLTVAGGVFVPTKQKATA